MVSREESRVTGTFKSFLILSESRSRTWRLGRERHDPLAFIQELHRVVTAYDAAMQTQKGTPIEVFDRLRASVVADRAMTTRSFLSPIPRSVIEADQGRDTQGLHRRTARLCTTMKDRINAELPQFIKA